MERQRNSVTVIPEVFGLPNLCGYGKLPDLWVAMTLDPVLKGMVQDLMARDYDGISDLAAVNDNEFENAERIFR
jgi:hypothetical protein